MTNKKTNCTFPNCVCSPRECAAEEVKHGKQLTFDHGWRERTPEIEVHERKSITDVIFAAFIAIIIISGSIGTGFYWAVKNTGNKLPLTEYTSRSIKVETEGMDTARIVVTEKSIYLYNTLNNEQKESLKESLEH